MNEEKEIPNLTDFRLIDSKVMDAFRKLNEKQRITRGLLDRLGFRKSLVHYDVVKRYKGRVQYTYLKLFKLVIKSFISTSLFPLRIAGYLGLGITFFSRCLGRFIIINQFVSIDYFQFAVSNIFSLAVLILFLVGIILSCKGLVAL